MAKLLSDKDRMSDGFPPQPRLRVNRSENMTLSTSWQRIDWNGNSNFNVNTFPTLGSNKAIEYDSTNKRFDFNQTEDRNYKFQCFYDIQNCIASTKIYYRFVIDAPTPIYFPFPEGEQQADLTEIAAFSDVQDYLELTFYANSTMRQYGVAFEIKVSSTLLGSPILQDTSALIYST